MDQQEIGTPLPELPRRFHDSPSIFGAYSQILNLEINEQAAYIRDGTENQRKRLMYARIVGYLILEGPSDQARVAVALEVISSKADEEKLAIGQHYFDHYLWAFRMNKGRTPTPSEHVSRPSFDNRNTTIMDEVVEAPQSHQQAKVNALVRDGFRCVITGQYDTTCVEHNKELEAVAGHQISYTECAHVFPDSINANISGKNMQGDNHHYAAGVWAVLDRFGYRKVFDELNGAGIHRLQNVLTLEKNVHASFDRLKLWLEPVESMDPDAHITYSLRAARPFYINPRWNRTVTFTTPDPEKLPVPSEDYLRLHAACCRVANLSGAGEHIDKILREMADIQVLSQDGTSAEALQYMLLPFSQQILVQ